jgi:hypothetical protein
MATANDLQVAIFFEDCYNAIHRYSLQPVPGIMDQYKYSNHVALTHGIHITAITLLRCLTDAFSFT